MSFWKRILGIGESSDTVRLVGEISQRSFDDVWARIGPVAYAMQLDELRGYVRARAAIIVHGEVDRAIADERAALVDRQELTARVMQSVVKSVAAELKHHMVLRRAPSRAA
jgi:hypothetical protein